MTPKLAINTANYKVDNPSITTGCNAVSSINSSRSAVIFLSLRTETLLNQEG